MGGNVTKQIAESKIENVVTASVNMSFESVQQNTQLVTNRQLIRIVQHGGFIQSADASQQSSQRLSIAAFTQSNVQAQLVSQIIGNIKQLAEQDATDSSLLQGFVNNTANEQRLHATISNSLSAAVAVTARQVNQQAADNVQMAEIEQQQAFLQLASAKQDSAQEMIIKSVITSTMSSSVISDLKTTLEGTMSQRITNPWVAMTEAISAASWGAIAILMLPLIIPFIAVILIATSVAYVYSRPGSRSVSGGNDEVTSALFGTYELPDLE